MKINKEGYKIIGLTGVVCFLLWALMYYLMSRHAEAGLLWFCLCCFGSLSWHFSGSRGV